MSHNFEFDPDTGRRVRPPADDAQGKLVACPDCSREVSRRASNCIHCGAPLAVGGPPAQQPEMAATVRRAGAAQEGIGFILIVAGMLIGMAGSGNVASIGGVLATVGFVIFIVGRFN